MSGTIPAKDLCPGDVISLGDYPCDLMSVYHNQDMGMTAVRWSVCDKDVMWISSDTPMCVLNRLDV